MTDWYGNPNNSGPYFEVPDVHHVEEQLVADARARGLTYSDDVAAVRIDGDGRTGFIPGVSTVIGPNGYQPGTAPLIVPGPEEELVNEIARIMTRGPNRMAWPQDEQDLWDEQAQHSYTHADLMLRRLRARKIIELVRG